METLDFFLYQGYSVCHKVVKKCHLVDESGKVLREKGADILKYIRLIKMSLGGNR